MMRGCGRQAVLTARTFLEMVAEALEDDTLRILLAAGALSLVLELSLEPEDPLAGAGGREALGPEP